MGRIRQLTIQSKVDGLTDQRWPPRKIFIYGAEAKRLSLYSGTRTMQPLGPTAAHTAWTVASWKRMHFNENYSPNWHRNTVTYRYRYTCLCFDSFEFSLWRNKKNYKLNIISYYLVSSSINVPIIKFWQADEVLNALVAPIRWSSVVIQNYSRIIRFSNRYF